MESKNKLIEIWKNIPNTVVKQGRTLRDFPSRFTRIRVGKSSPKGSLLVGFELDKKNNVKKSSFPKSQSFEINIVQNESNENVTLWLELLEASLENGFANFISDLIDSIIDLDDQKQIISNLRYKISDWFKLFANQGNKKLSKENEVGLFGELLCLQEYYLNSLDNFNAISFWTGPFSALHDFTSSKFSIEVKSTSQEPQMSISIGNCLQLDESRVIKLYLAIQKLEISVHGLILPELISKISDSISKTPDAMQKFNECLSAYGYNEKYKNEYKNRYLKNETSFFKVGNEFPKIKINDLKPGIHAVEYKIDIHSIEKYLISEDIIKKEIESLK